MEQYRTELSLLRTALWGGDRFPLEIDGAENWEKIFTELKAQAVAGIAADAVEYAPSIDPQVKKEWIQFVFRQMVLWNKLMAEQNALKDLLDREKIPFVILKGAAAAVYYSQPEKRAMGDVDIIVLPGDFERADGVLRANGYNLEETENDRHNGYRKNGIEFELHRYFSIFNDAEQAEALDQQIFNGIGNRTDATLENYTFPMLPKMENGLVLLAHIDQHLEGGLGLRQIIDWMLFVDREVDDQAWEQEFSQRVKALGKETLAVTVTRMCQLYLGLREENIQWCKGADEELCRELMEKILGGGNFGRKRGISMVAVSILGVMSRLSNIPKFLQTRGCINWKSLKKYPFLRPFAWLYQLCRYIRKLFTGEYSLGQMIRDMRQTGPTQQLMEKLGARQGRRTFEQDERKPALSPKNKATGGCERENK